MMQVELSVLLEDGLLVMPAGIVGYERSCTGAKDDDDAGIGAALVLTIPEIQVHLRLHDYFMGMLHSLT